MVTTKFDNSYQTRGCQASDDWVRPSHNSLHHGRQLYVKYLEGAVNCSKPRMLRHLSSSGSYCIYVYICLYSFSIQVHLFSQLISWVNKAPFVISNRKALRKSLSSGRCTMEEQLVDSLASELDGVAKVGCCWRLTRPWRFHCADCVCVYRVLCFVSLWSII